MKSLQNVYLVCFFVLILPCQSYWTSCWVFSTSFLYDPNVMSYVDVWAAIHVDAMNSQWYSSRPYFTPIQIAGQVQNTYINDYYSSAYTYNFYWMMILRGRIPITKGMTGIQQYTVTGLANSGTSSQCYGTILLIQFPLFLENIEFFNKEKIFVDNLDDFIDRTKINETNNATNTKIQSQKDQTNNISDILKEISPSYNNNLNPQLIKDGFNQSKKIQLYEMYLYLNTQTGNHVYSSEANMTGNYNYKESAFKFFKDPLSGALPVYQFVLEVSANLAISYFTLDQNQFSELTKKGWKNNNKILFYAFKENKQGTIPIYLYYKNSSGVIYWSFNHRQKVPLPGWVRDKVLCYVQPSSQFSNMYYYTNSKTGNVIYSLNANEIGFTSQQMVFRALKYKLFGALPIYQFLTRVGADITNTYLTLNENQFDNLTKKGWINNGVFLYGLKEYQQGTIPIYQHYKNQSGTIIWAMSHSQNVPSPWKKGPVLCYVYPPEKLYDMYLYLNTQTGNHVYSYEANMTGNYDYKESAFKFFKDTLSGALPVYQFVSQASANLTISYFTLDQNQFSELTKKGWKNNNKILFYAFKENKQGTIPIYLYYKNSSGVIYWSFNHRQKVPLPGWVRDKVLCYAYPSEQFVDMYLFTDNKTRNTLYSLNSNEVGYTSKQKVFKVLKYKLFDALPVYRYDLPSGSNIITSYLTLKQDQISVLDSKGWQNYGVLFYAFKQSKQGTIPLYQYYLNQNGQVYWSISHLTSISYPWIRGNVICYVYSL